MVDVIRTTPGTATAATSFSMVEWSCVLAGAVTAAALSFVFLTFGTAIGLATVSPWPRSGVSATTFSALGVFWVVAQQIGAFLAGGYIAGRMRTRWAEGSEDEVEFRDGLHGALVWAVGIVIGAMLIFAAAGAAARAGTDVASRALSAAATTNSDSIAYYADQLLRPRTAAAAAGQPAPQQSAPQTQPIPPETRAELGRVFARSLVNGTLADADRAYVASVVSQRTGLAPAEAEARVTQVYGQLSSAVRTAADNARRAAVLTGFVTAASLLLSLAAAWWAARIGGGHRDNAVPAQLVVFGSSIRHLR